MVYFLCFLIFISGGFFGFIVGRHKAEDQWQNNYEIVKKREQSLEIALRKCGAKLKKYQRKRDKSGRFISG